MDRIPVSSSNIRSIGYDPQLSVLEVAFLNGTVYQYSGVPIDVYNGLMAASSHGRYLARYIKGHYPHRQVG